MNKAFIGSKNYTKQNLKKVSRSKLLELCNTRGKESSPDLFTFQVALAGHDKVSDAGNHYKQKVQKMRDLPKTGVWSGKQFEDFKRK